MNESTIDLAEDFELRQHIKSFTSSSNRVGYVAITTTVVCLLILAGYMNSRQNSWTNSRVNLARVTLKYELWKEYTEEAIKAKVSEADSADSSLIVPARNWAKGKHLEDSVAVKDRLNKLELINGVTPWLFCGDFWRGLCRIRSGTSTGTTWHLFSCF